MGIDGFDGMMGIDGMKGIEWRLMWILI